MASYSIPLAGVPEVFAITIAGTEYGLSLSYRDAADGGWTLDIANSTDNVGAPILCGIPLVTGVDLLEQFAYLGLGFALYVVTEGDPLQSAPTLTGLGTATHLYVVTA